MIEWFLRFQQSVVERICWPYPSGKDSLVRWRALILSSILIAGFAFGLFAFIAAAILIIKENAWGLAVIDSLALALCVIFLFVHKIHFVIRASITLLMFYIIGLTVILSVGFLSGGPAWMFAFAVLSGILMGNPAALSAIFLNAITLTILGMLMSTGKIGVGFPFFKTSQAMMAAGVNFIVLNAISAVSVSSLVRGLFQLSQKKDELANGLETERCQLLETQKSLEAEIKERRHAEIELKESEKRYRHLFNNAPSGIYEIDFIKGKFNKVNQVMCKYSGYSEEDFLSMDPMDLLVGESKKCFLDNLKKTMSDKKNFLDNVEYKILKKDGEELCIILNSDFIFEGDKLTGARVVVHDITERKKIEAMIIQSEKMMSIGGLAAGMAHEINNPLAGMIQNAQVISARLTRDLPANTKTAHELDTSMSVIKAYMEKRGILRQLENINQAGIQAARIVENMLSFARKSGVTKKEQYLDELIERTIELASNDYNLKKKYDFKTIKLIREYEPDLPAVMCEKSKIQQVLFNIIKNASEAMHQNRLQNDTPTLILRLKREMTMVCIEIEDNGPGMSHEIQKRIFEPFFTTKSVDKGTGLGLSVSYFIIVEDHKGKMEVESNAGVGTKFIIKLPFNTKGQL